VIADVTDPIGEVQRESQKQEVELSPKDSKLLFTFWFLFLFFFFFNLIWFGSILRWACMPLRTA